MLLREILGTKYLTDEYEEDVRYLLDKFCECKRNSSHMDEKIYARAVASAINEALVSGKLELDLNDCRFTSKVWDALATIKKRQDSIYLSDSGDEDRENFIRSYMDFASEFDGLRRVTTLPPKPENIGQLANWVRGLDRGVVYKLIGEEYSKNPAILLIINMLAPEVMMEVDNISLITYAKTVFGDYMLQECDSFYYIYGNHAEFLEAYVNKDGKISVPNIGEFERNTFVRKFLCMPRFIGNEVPAFSTTSATLRAAMHEVMESVAAYLDDKPTTIETYFPLERSVEDDS